MEVKSGTEMKPFCNSRRWPVACAPAGRAGPGGQLLAAGVAAAAIAEHQKAPAVKPGV